MGEAGRLRHTAVFLLFATVSVTTVCSQLPHTIDLTWFHQVEGFSSPDPAAYKFEEFPYFETRKNEALFREYVKACEQTPACWNLEDVEQTNCFTRKTKFCQVIVTKPSFEPSLPRQCINPTCYNILYSADPLERGEIDVRLNSFKGCFHQFLQSRKSN